MLIGRRYSRDIASGAVSRITTATGRSLGVEISADAVGVIEAETWRVARRCSYRRLGWMAEVGEYVGDDFWIVSTGNEAPLGSAGCGATEVLGNNVR